MLLQCSLNISFVIQPMRSTVLPCWTKTFQHVRLEPELLLWLPEFQPYSRVAKPRKRSFSLSRALLPLRRGSNRKRAGDDGMDTLSLFLSPQPRGLRGGESPEAEGDLRKRLKFMQALTPVVQKLTNAILRIILYPMDSVTG